jgi:hypothetical protein
MAATKVARTGPSVRLSAADDGTGSADRVVNNPGCVDGELLIAIQSQSDGTAAGMTAPSNVGSEWTQRGDTGGDGTFGRMKIWYRTASNEGANWTFGGDGDGSVVVLVIPNWDTRGGDYLWDVEPTFNTGTAANQNSPSITMVRSTNRLIRAWASETGGAAYTAYEDGTYTEHQDIAANSANRLAVASQESGGAGTTGTYFATGGNVAYVAVAFALSSPPEEATSVNSPTVHLPHWSTVDNTLIAIVSANSAGSDGETSCKISSIVDDAHNTWIEGVTDFVTGYTDTPESAVRLSIWYCPGAKAITKLTATATQICDSMALRIIEATGITNVSTLDVSASDGDSDDSSIVATATTTNAADFVVAAAATGFSDRTITPASDTFTDLTQTTTDAGSTPEEDVAMNVSYKNPASAAAQTKTWTVAADANAVWAVLALKEGSVVATNANDFWPQMTHELGFGVDPNDPESVPSWTNVTDRVLSFNCRRGRDYELTRTEAGEADVRMRNDDGALDPTNTAGDYSPNVRVFTPYRIRAVWNGLTHSIFQGYVERWPQIWDDEYGTSPLEAVDGLATLSATRLEGTLSAEILADGPHAYWPLDDGTLSTTAANKSEITSESLNTIPSAEAGGPGGSGFFGATLDLQGEESTCWEQTVHGTVTPTIDSEYGVCLSNQLDLPTLAEGLLFECWAKFKPTSTARTYGLVTIKSGTGTEAFDRIAEIHVDSGDGLATLSVATSGGTWTEFSSGESGLNDDEWHHYVAHIVDPVSGDPEVKLWIDGALRVDDTIASVQAAAPDRIFVGGMSDSTGSQHFVEGRLAHVAVYELDASDDRRVAARANAGLFGFPERTGSRMSRLLGYAGWTAGRSIDEGQTLLGTSATIANQTLLAAVQDVANWENGLAFVDASGNFRFVDRLQRFNTSTTHVFGEDEANGEIPYETDVQIDYDPKYVYNDVKVTRAAGKTSTGSASSRKRDQDSIKKYFTRTLDKTSGAASLAQCQLEAQWIIDEYAEPRMRLGRITIVPSANPDLWPIALSVEIGDRVTVKRRPLNDGGDTITLDCYVEQVQHRVMPNRWEVIYSLSPRLDSTYEGDSGWILGVSTLGVDTFLAP